MMNRFICLLIRGYQLSIRLVIGPRCRFFPSCSDYAIESYQRHSLFTATRLTAFRLCRCRPGGGSGYDPVPEAFPAQVIKG
jgi:uncharacterized protein